MCCSAEREAVRFGLPALCQRVAQAICVYPRPILARDDRFNRPLEGTGYCPASSSAVTLRQGANDSRRLHYRFDHCGEAIGGIGSIGSFRAPEARCNDNTIPQSLVRSLTLVCNLPCCLAKPHDMRAARRSGAPTDV